MKEFAYKFQEFLTISHHPNNHRFKLHFSHLEAFKHKEIILKIKYMMAKNVDQRLAMAKRYSHEGVLAGAKAAIVAGVAAAIPTITSARRLQWARANLNPTAQALIVSTVAGAAYFIVADKTVLKSARQNSFDKAKIQNIDA